MAILRPIEEARTTLRVNSLNDCLTYPLAPGYDVTRFQFVMASAASFPAATITAEVSLNGKDFTGGQTYTALGVQSTLETIGCTHIRLRVTTAAGSGGEEVQVWATGTRTISIGA